VPSAMREFFYDLSGLQRFVEERQAHVHPVIHVGVVVVEFLVGVPDAGCREPLRQDACAVMDVILVAPAAVEVDAAQRLEVVPVFRNEMDRVVLAPRVTAALDHLTRIEIERHPESERRF